MQKFLMLLTCGLFLMPPISAAKEKTPSIFETVNRTLRAKHITKKVKDRIWKVKISTGVDNPGGSHGTGFVVDKNGYLVTNYHVISAALYGMNKIKKIFIYRGGKNIPAAVVGIDIINDLALLKVDKKFEDHFRLSKRKMAQGARIFSYGFPHDLALTVIEGTYNMEGSGIFPKINMSAPMNSGMSGGPILDIAGNLIGVNVSIYRESNSVSFGVPIKFSVENLLKGIGKEKDIRLNSDLLYEKVGEQLLYSQQIAYDSQYSFVYSKEYRVGPWTITKKASNDKCYVVNHKHLRDFVQHDGVTCNLQPIAFVENKIRTISGSVSFNVRSSEKISKYSLFDRYGSNVNEGDYFNARRSYLGSDPKYVLSTREICSDGFYKNKHDVVFKYILCASGYVRYKKLYHGRLKAITMHPESDPLIVQITARSFSAVNIKSIIMDHIEGIRKSTAKLDGKIKETQIFDVGTPRKKEDQQ